MSCIMPGRLRCLRRCEKVSNLLPSRRGSENSLPWRERLGMSRGPSTPRLHRVPRSSSSAQDDKILSSYLGWNCDNSVLFLRALFLRSGALI
jgi:hypothetical protein